MPICAGSECSKPSRYRRDWCSYECWEQGQKEMREHLRRFRAERRKKPLKAPRTMSDEEEVLGQPVGWKW